MKHGIVLEYNRQTKTGLVLDENGEHYNVDEVNLIDSLYLSEGDEISFESTDGTNAINVQLLNDSETEDCDHEFDMDEGGMCLNCGAENWFDYIDEDYGRDR